jgi:ribosome maturation factor RimP
MDRLSIIGELRAIVEDYLKGKNLILVDLIYRYEGNKLILRILADRPEGGILVEDCASVNNDIGRILEEKDLLKENYILEVFSPGLDRPLKTKDDFRRCLNRAARFFFNEQVNGKLELTGIIKKAEEDKIYIGTEAALIEVPLAKVRMGKQVY